MVGSWSSPSPHTPVNAVSKNTTSDRTLRLRQILPAVSGLETTDLTGLDRCEAPPATIGLTDAAAAIEVSRISAGYGSMPVLHGIDLSVRRSSRAIGLLQESS